MINVLNNIFPHIADKMRSFSDFLRLIICGRERYRELTDEEAVRAFLQGEQPVFNEIVERHKDMVFSLCYNIMNDYDDAHDCAQDVFIRVHDRLCDFGFRSALSTWIYKIAMNLCRDRLKTSYRKRVRNFAVPEESDRISSQYLTPHESIERDETENAIRCAIEQLPENERVLIVLRDLEGRSYDEIAGITGIPEGTVKSRLARGRKGLRSLLKGVI